MEAFFQAMFNPNATLCDTLYPPTSCANCSGNHTGSNVTGGGLHSDPCNRLRGDQNASDEPWWADLPKKSELKRVMEEINLYVTPIIIVLGVVGNLLSFLVFSFTHLRRSSSSLFLANLALVDTGFLLALLIVWLDEVQVPLFHQEGWCQLVVYITHLCPFLSVWNVVGFTAERYIIVWHPLRKDRFCTPRKVKSVITAVTCLGFVMSSFNTWTSGIMVVHKRSVCMPFPQFYDVITVFTSIDLIVTLITPSLIILVLNLKITFKIHQIQKRISRSRDALTVVLRPTNVAARRSTLQASVSDKGSMHFRFGPRSLTDADQSGFSSPPEVVTRNPTVVTFKGRSQYRLARMLLIVSSIFVLLNIPSHYFKIQAFIQPLFANSYKTSKRELQWQELFQLVYYLNFAINFFLYSACGRPFRSGLRSLVVRLRYNWRNRRSCYTILKERRKKKYMTGESIPI